MKNKFISFILIFILALLISCKSATKSTESRELSFKDIEKIPLGTSANDSLQALGPPEEQSNDDGANEKGWLYFNPKTGFQSAFLSFNTKLDRLDYKFAIPAETDQEAVLDFVLHQKFRDMEFQPVAYPQCGMDYFKSEALYADSKDGILIRYRKSTKKVLSISWSSPDEVRREIKDILGCAGKTRSASSTQKR